VFVPLSIPSPDYVWQAIPLGRWLHDLGLTFVSTDLNIRSYAICILIGIVVAGIMTHRRLTRRGAEPGIMLDIIIWAIPLGIVGARIFHVLTHPNDYFGEGIDPLSVFYVWEGGIAIFGALIGGAVGAWIGCWRTGIRFWTFADAVAPGLLLAQAFGRFGNWFNHELFGLPVSSDYPLGLEIESSNSAYPPGLPDGTLFHPTFLYEVVWNSLGVLVILFIERALRLQWGKTLAVYLIWYGLGRTVFESIRIDPSEYVLGLRVNVWAAILAILIGIAIIAIQSRRHPGTEPSPYVAGREWVPVSSEVDSEETYSDTSNVAESNSEELALSASATSGTASEKVAKP